MIPQKFFDKKKRKIPNSEIKQTNSDTAVVWRFLRHTHRLSSSQRQYSKMFLFDFPFWNETIDVDKIVRFLFLKQARTIRFKLRLITSHLKIYIMCPSIRKKKTQLLFGQIEPMEERLIWQSKHLIPSKLIQLCYNSNFISGICGSGKCLPAWKALSRGIVNPYTEQSDIDKRLWEWSRDYRECNAHGNRDVYCYKTVSASRRVRRETVDEVGTPFLTPKRASEMNSSL